VCLREKRDVWVEFNSNLAVEPMAALVETSAKTERFKPFLEEAKVAGLMGTDVDNLKDAILR
jgi:hypothetical protein